MFNDKKIFDEYENLDRVVIEYAFGALKNQSRIVKHLYMNMDKAVIVSFACSVLYSFCDIYAEQIPLREDVAQRPDPFVGVR